MNMFGKKRGVFVILAMVLLVQGVFAAGEDTILSISSTTNAHGELGTENNYNIIINYTEIFGIESSFVDPYTCTGNNLVLKLSGTTNAHAEVPTGVDYTTDVCFGDLVCSVVTGGAACSGSERIVGLSATTNAHLEVDGSYGFSICCTSADAGPVTGTISDLYWADNAGNKLIDGDGDGEVDFLKYVGNKVWLVVETNLGSGQEVIFDIKESDTTTPDDDILSGDPELTVNTDSTGKAIFKWEILPADMTTGGIDRVLEAEGDILEFFFNAAITGNSAGSIILNVKNEAGDNSPPVAVITSPAEGIYLAGETITLNHFSFDIDNDIVSIEWNIEGATYTTDSVPHTLISDGRKDITLTVTDKRGAIDTDKVSIRVIDPTQIGIYVFSKIDQPNEGVTIKGEKVSYDGSSSYAIEVTASNTLICAGGDCPVSLGGLDVTDPNTKKGDYNDMEFSWSYGSDNADVDSGIGLTTGSKIYTSIGNGKTIELSIVYEPSGESDSIVHTFNVVRANGCSLNGDIFVEDSGLELLTSIPNVCKLAIGGCCPGGSSCVSGDYGFVCDISQCDLSYTDDDDNLVSIISCGDYNEISGTLEEKRLQCESCSNDVGVNPNNPELIAAKKEGSLTSPRCGWDAEVDKCRLEFDRFGSGSPPEILECWQEEFSNTGCGDDKRQIIIYTEICEDENGNEISNEQQDPITIPCGGNVIQLPFFSMINAIVGLIAISLIYFIFRRNEN